MKLSIIIVNYNVKYFLEQCLHSVLLATPSIEAEVLVVDNNSSDGSIEYLKPLFPGVIFIDIQENLGFGKANNLALARAKGEYILFLNPDTIVPEDCFTKCIGFLEKNSKAGALGVRMLDGSGQFLPESKRSFPSTSTAFFKATGLSSLFPESQIFNRYALGYLNNKENHPVDVLAGAFMMVRKHLLDKTGGFDEQFFMYGEDIDLSYRLKQLGYENWYFAETSIIHFKGESLKKWSTDHVNIFYRAMIVFVKKHYNGKGAGLLKLLLISAIRLKSFFSLVKGRVSSNEASDSKAENKFIIVGSTEEYQECLNIYRSSGFTTAIDHYEPGEQKELTGKLQDLNNQNRRIVIVFCRGKLFYHAIIPLIEQLNECCSYRFHAFGSKSIVGSDSKSKLGEVLSFN